MNYATYIGIDAHKLTNSVCLLDADTASCPACTFPSDPDYLVKWIAESIGQGEVRAPVLCVYEAGPTGYGLYRALVDAGYDCVVAAPSKLPRRSDRKKNDEEDARWLARMALSGALRPVAVPDMEHEALRELVCAREDACKQLTRAKQRLRSFMLRHSIVYTETRRLWTKTFMAWSERLSFKDRTEEAVWNDLTSALRQAEERKALMEGACERAIASSARLSFISRCLQALPGIGPALSLALIAKVGTAFRFSSPHAFSSYLGMVPSEHSSGASVRKGGITKTGDSALRRLFVESAIAATRQVHRLKFDDDIPEVICRHAKELSRRLVRRRDHMRACGKHAGVIRCALARELAQKAIVVFKAAELLFEEGGNNTAKA